MTFGSPKFSQEGEHTADSFAIREISIAEVPEHIGEKWKQHQAAYLPTGYGEDWRNAFTKAFIFTHEGFRPGEALYALVNKSNNPDAGEFVSFALVEDEHIVNQGLMAFNTKNRPSDANLPPLYENMPVAFLLFTNEKRQKGGAGKRVLSAMNAFSERQYGKPLHSDIERHHLLNQQGERPGWTTWKSLKRDGVVESYETDQGMRFRFVTSKAEEEGEFPVF